MNHKSIQALFFSLFTAFVLPATAQNLEAVPYVDLCDRQVLTPLADGRVGVHNSCRMNTVDGEYREITGTATSDDPISNAKFTVDLGLPQKGQYWVIGLDAQYRYAVVSEPSRKSLYILSKTPELSEELYQEALNLAAQKTDTSKLQRTLQQGCSYPTNWIPEEVATAKTSPFVTPTALISEAQFRQVIADLQTEFAPIVSGHGGKLSMSGNWKDEKPNAGATQVMGSWQIKTTGGLARQPALTEDGLTLILCHELGHHLAGFPIAPKQMPFESTWASVEAQSDYYATQFCARRLWSKDPAKNASFRDSAPADVKSYCDTAWASQNEQNICYRTLVATTSMIETMAKLMQKPMPQFNTPDPLVVTVTNMKYPSVQCRMDTAFQGTLCAANFDPLMIPGKKTSQGPASIEAEKEAAATSCTTYSGYSAGLRPNCWFKAQL